MAFSFFTVIHVGNDGGKLVRIFSCSAEIHFRTLACQFCWATGCNGLLFIGSGDELAIVCLHIEIASLHRLQCIGLFLKPHDEETFAGGVDSDTKLRSISHLGTSVAFIR